MDARADAIRLLAVCLGPNMVYVFNGEIKLIGVVFDLAALLRAAICEDSQQADLVLSEEGDHAVVQQVRSRDGRFLGVEYVNGHAGLGIDEGLLINPAHTLHCAHVIGVLAAQLTRLSRILCPGVVALR